MAWLSRCGARIGRQRMDLRMDDDDRSAHKYREGPRVLVPKALPKVDQMPRDVGWKGTELFEKISLKQSGKALSGCSCNGRHRQSRVH